MLDVLVVAPHPDDAELGMAGAILKFKDDGWRVGILDLTSGEPTPFGTPEIRAGKRLRQRPSCGLTGGRTWAFPTAAWKQRWTLGQSWPPSFACNGRGGSSPYWVDAHPDHVAATELVEAARFWSKLTKTEIPGEPYYPQRIFYYYCVHLRLIPQPAFVLDISPYWERKRLAIECYQSQFVQGRPQEPPTFIDRLRDQAATWGWSIGTQYGEAFASREPVGLATMTGLI